MRVLFVCTGNTCRSPMAQAICEAFTDHEASSCGLGAGVGEPVSDYAQKALESLGITDFTHTSRQITPRDIEEAERVYVMTPLHRQLLVTVCPEAADKIRLLGGDHAISDPFGGSEEQYLACCQEIKECIQRELC